MIPVEFFIIGSGVIGAVIGALGVHLYHRHRRHSIQAASWKLARIYFQKLYSQD